MNDNTETTNKIMLVNLANEYSPYARAELSEEVSRLDEYMQECIAKMDELSTLFDMTAFEQKDWPDSTLPKLMEQTSCLNEVLSKRLESLKTVIETTRESLDKIEEQMNQTSGENTTQPSSLRSVLNYFKKPDADQQEAPIAKPFWNR